MCRNVCLSGKGLMFTAYKLMLTFKRQQGQNPNSLQAAHRMLMESVVMFPTHQYLQNSRKDDEQLSIVDVVYWFIYHYRRLMICFLEVCLKMMKMTSLQNWMIL